MNANELADEWDAQGFSEYELERKCGNQMANMLRQQQAKIAEQERTIKGNQIHIRKLEMVTYWLVENRPEVWEDIRKWAENERK